MIKDRGYKFSKSGVGYFVVGKKGYLHGEVFSSVAASRKRWCGRNFDGKPEDGDFYFDSDSRKAVADLVFAASNKAREAREAAAS